MEQRIIDMCMEISKWLNETQDPYKTIIIDSERIRLVQDELGIPTNTN